MEITTIIPTLCESSRSAKLSRAIESIHAASARPVKVVVVVNGIRYDRALLEKLKLRSDVDVVQLEQGSQTLAQMMGRKHVQTEFFSFLDDDDEFLPGALDLRLNALKQDQSASVAVTNGYSSIGGIDSPLYSRMTAVSSNPLHELFHENWLHNCNHLFRSNNVGIEYFESAPPVLEWTWLGFRLAMTGRRIISLNDLTFRYNDTPGSLSKSSNFLMARVALYNRMLSSSPPPAIAALIKRRKTGAWHDMAVSEMRKGKRLSAALSHFKSMTCHWSGLRYCTYTRHLLSLRKKNAAGGEILPIPTP